MLLVLIRHQMIDEFHDSLRTVDFFEIDDIWKWMAFR